METKVGLKMDEYKPFEEMSKEEKILSLTKYYSHTMKCPCEKCKKKGDEILDRIKKVEDNV